MRWLIIAIISYFLFAVNSFFDRYLLTGRPNPKVYAFYVGILSILVVFIIPLVPFYLPSFSQISLSFLASLVFIISILFLYTALKRFEVSRIIPALGGFLPVFTFLLALFLIDQEGSFDGLRLLSFILLILGSIFISLEKSFGFSFKALMFAALSGFFLSLYFVLSKIIYSGLGFWPGFIWVRLGVFVLALFLVLFREVREEVFFKKRSFTKKTGVLFLANQSVGAGALILQNWAIALAGGFFLSFVAALQGVQYVFLFILTLIVSLKSPGLLKENFSKRVILQKAIAIILILAGLGLLGYNI